MWLVAAFSVSSVLAPVANAGSSGAISSKKNKAKKKKKAVKQSCHPSYKDACLKPNVSDYDCAGGTGNGPYYVNGPIRVIGSDPYRLDADRNGVGCE
jgi:hypothetical protein